MLQRSCKPAQEIHPRKCTTTHLLHCVQVAQVHRQVIALQEAECTRQPPWRLRDANILQHSRPHQASAHCAWQSPAALVSHLHRRPEEHGRLPHLQHHCGGKSNFHLIPTGFTRSHGHAPSICKLTVINLFVCQSYCRRGPTWLPVASCTTERKRPAAADWSRSCRSSSVSSSFLSLTSRTPSSLQRVHA